MKKPLLAFSNPRKSTFSKWNSCTFKEQKKINKRKEKKRRESGDKEEKIQFYPTSLWKKKIQTQVTNIVKRNNKDTRE